MFILTRSSMSTRSLLTNPSRVVPVSSTTPKMIHNIHTSPPVRTVTKDTPPSSNARHTADTYSKDVDTTPVEDTSVFRVDPSSELVQKPHEPPSGAWSRVGVQSAMPGVEAYQTAQGGGQGVPYEPKGGKGERYGSRMSWADDKGKETSGPEDGPAQGSSKGRK